MPKDVSIEQTEFYDSKSRSLSKKDKNIVDMITTVGQTSDGLGVTQSTALQS